MKLIGKKIFRYFSEIANGRKSTNKFVDIILRFLSYIFLFLVNFRNFIFKFKKINRFENLSVISIGNITAGGNGKTPLVAFFLENLNINLKISVLSRGYKSNLSNNMIKVSKKHNFREVGDELLMLFKRYGSYANFIACKNRTQACSNIEKGIVILDDGFQSISLYKNLNILSIDAVNPFGKGTLLPHGILREPKSSLKKADLITIVNANLVDNIDELIEEVKKYTNVPIFTFDIYFDGVFNNKNEKVSIVNENIAIFSAIAKPQNFYKSIEIMGGNILEEFYKDDHDEFYYDELKEFISKSSEKGIDKFICTEKDFVKLNEKFLDKILYLKISFKITKEREKFYELIKNYIN